MSHWTIFNDTICNDVALKIVPVRDMLLRRPVEDNNSGNIVPSFWTHIKNTQRVASLRDTQKIVRKDMSHHTSFCGNIVSWQIVAENRPVWHKFDVWRTKFPILLLFSVNQHLFHSFLCYITFRTRKMTSKSLSNFCTEPQAAWHTERIHWGLLWQHNACYDETAKLFNNFLIYQKYNESQWIWLNQIKVFKRDKDKEFPSLIK